MQSYKWPLALLAATLGAQAQAQSMNAEAFYQRAEKLKGKGPLAVFQRKEIEALAKEANAAIARSNTQRRATLSAGSQPRFCPPVTGGARLTSNDLLQGIAAIPQAERRRIDTTEAMTRFFARRFPC